jgi:hypothetical protein
LELDDRIADLLPEGWSLPESAREITLRYCTTHTSGIPRLPTNLFTAAGVFRHLLGGDPYRDYSEQQFRDALATVELQFEPGADRLYSNFAVGLLGFVLAERNGLDYETLVTSIWHNGGTGGFSTYLGFTEDCQVGVFVLSNTALGVDALAGRMISALVQEYASDSGELERATPVAWPVR